jgi:hypothetical protein
VEIKYTITTGEIIQIVSLLFVVFGFYNKISVKMGEMQTDLNTIKKWWEHAVLNCNTSVGD